MKQTSRSPAAGPFRQSASPALGRASNAGLNKLNVFLFEREFQNLLPGNNFPFCLFPRSRQLQVNPPEEAVPWLPWQCPCFGSH